MAGRVSFRIRICLYFFTRSPAHAALALPPGWQLVPVAQFHRSLLIELKQRNAALYQLERTRTL